MPVVGVLGSSSPDPTAHGPFVAALLHGLSNAGFIEGRNVAIGFAGHTAILTGCLR